MEALSLPFTSAQFMDVFARYHNAVGIAPLIMLALGLLSLRWSFARSMVRRRGVAVILAALWVWVGAVYQLRFFASINPAARIFAALFILQGALFLWDGAFRQSLCFDARAVTPRSRFVGALLVAYALLVYPLFGLAIGHIYPSAPTFGLPCPTVIFSLGLLLWAKRPWPFYLAVIPVIWALIGTTAAAQLGMWEDLGLPLAAILLLVVEFTNQPSKRAMPTTRTAIQL